MRVSHSFSLQVFTDLPFHPLTICTRSFNLYRFRSHPRHISSRILLNQSRRNDRSFGWRLKWYNRQFLTPAAPTNAHMSGKEKRLQSFNRSMQPPAASMPFLSTAIKPYSLIRSATANKRDLLSSSRLTNRLPTDKPLRTNQKMNNVAQISRDGFTRWVKLDREVSSSNRSYDCLLYTSDAADE